MDVPQSMIDTFARKFSETAKGRYSPSIILTNMVNATWVMKENVIAGGDTGKAKVCLSEPYPLLEPKSKNGVCKTMDEFVQSVRDAVTRGHEIKSEPLDEKLSQEPIREDFKNRSSPAHVTAETDCIKEAINQTLTRQALRKDGSRHIARSATNSHIFPRKHKVLKHRNTCAIFPNVIKENPTNPEIETLLETEIYHQESLKKKNTLRDFVEDVQRQKANSPILQNMTRSSELNLKRHEQDNVSELSASSEDSGEILTLYDAMQGLSLRPPAYWIGCSYVYQATSNTLEIKIRQTGVHPRILKESRPGRILLEVSLSSRKSQRHTVCLIKSTSDNSFKSHSIVFKHIIDGGLKQQNLRLRVFYRTGVFQKKLVSQWYVPLPRCKPKFEKSDWKRCEF